MVVMLPSKKLGLLAALIPTASSSFHPHSIVEGWKSRSAMHRTNSNNKQPTTSVALHAAAGGGDPQGLWKALGDLSPDIIPPANAMDDPFPGVGLSIDSLYGDSTAQVAKKVAEPVAKAVSEPVTAKAASDSMVKASEEMSKASDKFSKAFDSAFTAAKTTAATTTNTEPVLQASSAATTTTSPATTAASAASEQIVAQVASEPVAKAVEPVVQATVKASEPVLQAATPAIKTGAYAVQPNEYMMQVVEKNSALSKSISDAVHGTVEKVGSAFSFQIPEPSYVANKEAIVKGGTSSVDMVGMFDNIKFNFDVPTVESIKISPEQFAMSPEQLEAIRQNIAEFGKDYVAALDSFYHISEFQQALVTGTAFNEAIRDIIAYTNDVVEKLDLEHYSGWYATLAVFFWGATQRREGEVLGRLLSERKIQNIEKELAKTKAKAEKEDTKKASEVEELKEQMELLKSQVQMLTDAAKDVREKLEQANEKQAAAAGPKPEPEKVPEPEPEPVMVEEVKEVESKPAPAKKSKTKGSKKRATKTIKDEVKSPVAKKNTKTKRKTVKVKGTKSQVSAKKTTKSKSTPKKIVVSSEDWSRLSESTLKRKTIKELTGYLNERGMDVTDSDGKTLKKDNLVELVMSN